MFNAAGRSRGGRITVLSKGNKLTKSKYPRLKYDSRDNSISFVSALSNSMSNNSQISCLASFASGLQLNMLASNGHFLFRLHRTSSIFSSASDCYKSILLINKSIRLHSPQAMLLRVGQGDSISNIELAPGSGSKYSRSLGCKSTLLKVSLNAGSAVLKLPSKAKKIFSVYSLASPSPEIRIDKRLIKITSSSKSLLKGVKPRSRGVSKNPVDHPHGGRTKAIRYPRTPWGKTAKLK